MKSYLLGIVPLSMFLAMVFFAAIGVLMALLFDATKRDQNSTSTPVKFSFWFLIKDNWKTIALAFMAVLLTLRFAPLLFPGNFTLEGLETPTVIDKWLFGSFAIGLVYDTLLQVLKQRAGAITQVLLKADRT